MGELVLRAAELVGKKSSKFGNEEYISKINHRQDNVLSQQIKQLEKERSVMLKLYEDEKRPHMERLREMYWRVQEVTNLSLEDAYLSNEKIRKEAMDKIQIQREKNRRDKLMLLNSTVRSPSVKKWRGSLSNVFKTNTKIKTEVKRVEALSPTQVFLTELSDEVNVTKATEIRTVSVRLPPISTSPTQSDNEIVRNEETYKEGKENIKKNKASKRKRKKSRQSKTPVLPVLFEVLEESDENHKPQTETPTKISSEKENNITEKERNVTYPLVTVQSEAGEKPMNEDPNSRTLSKTKYKSEHKRVNSKVEIHKRVNNAYSLVD